MIVALLVVDVDVYVSVVDNGGVDVVYVVDIDIDVFDDKDKYISEVRA